MSDLTRLAQQFRDEDEQQQSPAFGELADRFRQEDAANANAALFATEQVRPDDAAQARRVASEFNTSFEFASANREELTAAELNNRLSATLRNSSALAGFMAVPENAAVARDDTDALAELEVKVRRANRDAQFDVGNILQDFGFGAGSLFGRGLRGLGTEMEAIGRRTFSETVQSEDFDPSSLADRLLAFGALGLEVQGVFARQEGQDIQSAVEPFATPAEERGFANDVSNALGQIVGGVGVAAIPYVGAPAAGGLFFGAGVDEQAQRMEAAGVEPSENLLALTGGGAVEAGLEMLRVGRILDTLPPSVRQRVAREALGRIVRQGAEEASEEVIAGVLQNVLETSYNEDAEIFNLDEAIQEGGTAFTASAILQGVIEVALPGRARVARAQEAATELQGERDAAKETQLHTRDLGALRDFMNRLDPDAEVHVNARMLMQGENAAEAAAALGLTADEIAEAAVGDGDVAVPRRVFTTIENDQMFAELVQITRERPDAAMLAEANEEIETIIRDYAERVSTQQVSESDIQTVSDTIYEQLTQRIGHTPDAARAQADVIAAGISRIALDAGMTPEQLFEQIGLQVRRPEQTPQDVELEAALNDLRRGAIPDEAQAYGPSLQDLAREFGIDIRGGELNLRDEGQLDEFGERAAEEGFFLERPDVAAIEDALLGDELRIAENRNVDLARRREMLLEMQDLLERRGVPIETATVADVQQGVAEDAQSRELGQGFLRRLFGGPRRALADFAFSGSLRAAHRGRIASTQDISDPADVPADQRFDGDGGEFGDGFYMDEDGKWVLQNVDLYFATDNIAGVEVSFENAFMLTPESVQVIAREMGVSQIDRSSDIADFIRGRGHDGVIVRGFDAVLEGKTPEEEARYLEGLGLRDGGSANVAQDQIVAFRPSESVEVLDTFSASEISQRDEDTAEGGLGVNRLINDDFGAAFLPARPSDARILNQSTVTREAVDALSDDIKSSLGLETLFLSLRNGDLQVSMIEVAQGERQQGKGTQAMERIAEFADQNGLRVTLTPGLRDDRHGTTSRARLVRFYKRFGFVENKGRNRDFAISDGMYRDPRGGALLQDQFNRGSITIPDAGVLSDENVVIRLGEAHDLSTFAHEGAHLFLELYRELAPQSPAIAARYAKIEEFLGIEPGGEITTDQHELWARTFEAYLREGKAPSIELRGAFQRFKSWLARIYRSLLSIGETKLNDEARQIFDSILATEGEVAANREAERMEMSATYSGLMDEKTIEKYGEAARAARGEAEEKALQVHTEQIAREHQREWRDARRQARKEEEANYWAEPANAAFWLLTRGTKKTGETPRYLEGAKLDRAAVEELIGPSGVQALPKSKTRVYTSEGGVVPDQVAPEFGFMNGHEMLLAMMESRAQGKPEQVINQRADALTRERLGDPRRDGTAERVAREAVYSDKAIKLLRVEADFLASKALRRPMPAQSIKAAADRIINTRPVKETVKPGTYALRAQRAADKALRLAAAEKWAEALEMKQTQILNAELARRAFKARDEVARINRVFRRVRTKKYDTKKFHPRFVEHIKGLLNLFENGEGDRLELEAFAANVNEGQFAGALLMPLGATKEPTTMTLDELRDLRDALLSGEKAGRLNGELAEEEFQARGQELADFILEAWGDRERKDFKRQQEIGDNVAEWARKTDAAILRWPFMVEALQGGKDGKLMEVLENDLRAAVTEAMTRQADLDDKFTAIMEKNGITQEELNRRVSVPELQLSGDVKFEALVALAMNMGNEGNRARLDKDPTIRADMERIAEILDENLEKRHWDAVQETWDLIDTLWPEVSELERRTTGVTPRKIEATPIATRHGTYAGGYYPISYDHRHATNTDLAGQTVDDIWAARLTGSGAQAQTSRGHTKERVNGVRRAVDLRLTVALDHFRSVSRDIHMRESVDTIWRLLNKSKMADAIRETHGREYLEAMKTILKRTVVGTQRPQNLFEQITRGFRINSSIAILGHNVVSAALAPVSYFQTVIPRYGVKVVGQGLSEYYGGGPAQTIEVARMINEKSTFMRERTQTLNREAHERIRRSPHQSRYGQMQGAGFLMMSYIEKYSVSGPLWLGVYRQAVSEGKSEREAVAEADRSVATTQGSGLELDQNVLQGGNELERWFTYMWGYMSGYYGTVRNDVSRQKGTARKTAALVKHLLIANIAASMVEALVRYGFGTEEEPYWMNVLELMRRNVFGLIPGVSMFEGRYGSGPAIVNFGAKVKQAADAYVEMGEEFFEDGEVDGETAEKAARRTVEVGMFGAGIPGATQLNRIVKTLTEDDDPTIFEALITGPDDDN